MVLDGILNCAGDLQAFVEDWVTKADSGGEEYPFAVRSTSESSVGNTAYCYVLDVERRRLDGFGTHVARQRCLVRIVNDRSQGHG